MEAAGLFPLKHTLAFVDIYRRADARDLKRLSPRARWKILPGFDCFDFDFGRRCTEIGHRLGQGRENSKQTLKENPEVLRRIETDVKRALGLPVREEAAAEVPVEQKKAVAATEKK